MTEIAKKAFLGDRSIAEKTIGEDVTYIDDWAFAKCISLRKLTIPHKVTFGRNVFEGCDTLTQICLEGKNDDLSYLFAIAAHSLPNCHLIRDDDIGSDFWIERFDLALSAYVCSDDSKGFEGSIPCGEEDISYDGIGMIDGEMPSETYEYVKKISIGKCRLCYTRLIHDIKITPKVRKNLETYIYDHRRGTLNGTSWETIVKSREEEKAFLEIYFQIVRPDTSDILAMIEELPSGFVQMRSMLIGMSSSQKHDNLTDMYIL